MNEEKAWLALVLPLDFVKAVSEPSYDKNAFVQDLMVLLSETKIKLDWKCLPGLLQSPFLAQETYRVSSSHVSQAEMPSNRTTVLLANSIYREDQELSRHTNHPDAGVHYDSAIDDTRRPLVTQPSLSWDDEVSQYSNAQFGLEMEKNAENDHQRSRKRPSSAQWHIDDTTTTSSSTIAEEVPGSTLPFQPNRSCRVKGCKKRYRSPGYLCEDHGGGRCQAYGCTKV